MSFNPDNRQLGQIKFALFAICLLPALRLLWAAYTDDFGAEPEEFVQRWTGTWTFNLLLITLCVTPLRAMTQMHWLTRLRRTLGLFCFFYATLLESTPSSAASSEPMAINLSSGRISASRNTKNRCLAV